MRSILRAASAGIGASMAALVVVASCSGETSLPPARPDSGTACNPFCIDARPIPTCDDALLACQVVVHLYKSCSGPTEPNCHGGDNPANFLLQGDPEKTLTDQLVLVKSTERKDWFRVDPGNPQTSWIIAKLRNDKDAGVETAMPLGSDGDLDFAKVVEDWIKEGAPTSLHADAGDAGDEADADADADPDADSTDADADADADADVDSDAGGG